MKFQKIFILLFANLILFLSACSPNGKQNNHVSTTRLINIPTPSATTGVVIGRIISETTDRPPDANLFLSKNLTAGQTEIPAMLSFSFQTNPHAKVDDYGNFYFADVSEGVYAVTLWTPPNNVFFVPNETGQDYFWVTVMPGKTIDVGEIKVP